MVCFWDSRKCLLFPPPSTPLVEISLKIRRTQNRNTNSVLVETREKHATELLLVIEGERGRIGDTGEESRWRQGAQSLWSREEARWGGGWRQEPLKNTCSLLFRLHPVACEIWVPWPGIKLVPPVVEVWSLNHWIAKVILFFFQLAHFCLGQRFLPWLHPITQETLKILMLRPSHILPLRPSTHTFSPGLWLAWLGTLGRRNWTSSCSPPSLLLSLCQPAESRCPIGLAHLGRLPLSGTAGWVHLILGCRGRMCPWLADREPPPPNRPGSKKAAVLTSISLTPAPTFQLALYTFSGSCWKMWSTKGREDPE